MLNHQGHPVAVNTSTEMMKKVAWIPRLPASGRRQAIHATYVGQVILCIYVYFIDNDLSEVIVSTFGKHWQTHLPSAHTATIESGVDPNAQMQGVPPGTSMRENDHSDEKYLGSCNVKIHQVGCRSI